jgi:hypothetical protein
MDINKIIEDQKKHFEEKYKLCGLSSGLYGDYATTVAKESIKQIFEKEIERKKLMKTQCDICRGSKYIWETKEQSERGEKPTFICQTCNGTGELTYYLVEEDIVYFTSMKEKLLK